MNVWAIDRSKSLFGEYMEEILYLPDFAFYPARRCLSFDMDVVFVELMSVASYGHGICSHPWHFGTEPTFKYERGA